MALKEDYFSRLGCLPVYGQYELRRRMAKPIIMNPQISQFYNSRTGMRRYQHHFEQSRNQVHHVVDIRNQLIWFPSPDFPIIDPKGGSSRPSSNLERI